MPLSNETEHLEPILSAAAMREADRKTIEEFGIPGFTLMESAGRAAAARILSGYITTPDAHVVCLCGKGNNGGDGFVIARVLANLDIQVTVISTAPEHQLTRDAGLNYRLLRRMKQQGAAERLHLLPYSPGQQLPVLSRTDTIVDALLGTGINSTLRSPYLELVQWINEQPAQVVSIDIPTGLHADTGAILGKAVQADLTLSMGAHKTGLFLGEGYAHVGDAEAAEIGIPRFLLQEAALEEGSALATTTEWVKSQLPRRSPFAHKYSVGMALIVAGSRGLTGAATLASLAAEQAGAGAIICATPQEVQPLLASKMTEVMTLGLATTETGIDSENSLFTLAAPLKKANALLVGCGMGQQPDTQAFIRSLAISHTGCPVILDADGLNAFQGHTHLFSEHAGGQWILTPHLGEFKRLAGDDVDLTNRILTVKHYAASWNCVLILKGSPSIVGTPEGSVYINPGVNPALATAGTGDVLAGLCAGLLSQGLSPEDAALCALHIGLSAAEFYSSNEYPATMRASDLIYHIRIALSERYQ